LIRPPFWRPKTADPLIASASRAATHSGMRALPDRLYHLAEAANLDAIQRDGLKPAEQLIAESGADAEAARAWRSAQRNTHVVLPSGVEIRDQKPMPASALRRCLVGMSPAEWYEEINARVFLWIDPERMARQQRACGGRPQVILTIDSAALLTAYGSSLAVSPINSGNARRAAAIRGRATFVAYEQWCTDGWASEARALGTTPRSRSHAPVEVTRRGAIPNLMAFVRSVSPIG
jgi:hypothetical protein